MRPKHSLKLSGLPCQRTRVGLILTLMAVLMACANSVPSPQGTLPSGFVDIQRMLPEVLVDVRYASDDNFMGRPADGYLVPKIFMSIEAAAALVAVQSDLRTLGLGLKIFDAYRPQRAVDHFVRWAEDLDDTRMKARYYPQVAKSTLFRDGYIAARSGHSRGSTVDLTLVELATGTELDMGSPWDFFDPVSWPDSTAVNAEQQANRLRLREVMLRYGFVPITTEWWHFTLGNEPYSEQYFDFPIQ
jgi:D-alanyl-D-alanine dipeptidase